MPANDAALDQRLEVLEVLVADGHDSPSLHSNVPGAIRFRIMFSRMHSTPASRSPTA